MIKSTLPTHPGAYVKENIIPEGVSVKKAAEMLGVGRPALSNFLNGKANLSQNMATRLEKAFGADKEALLNFQQEYNSYIARDQEKRIAVKSYTPSFLKITATQLDAWADKIEARSLLAVFLRRMVNTTGNELISSDFPAYDLSQKLGWDGLMESNTATPWIPSGVSGWEFGCNKDIKTKADKDYIVRTESIVESKRKNITFVFVTPRNWPNKNKWLETVKSKNEWGDVRAYDASDLEQWLELSVPAQVWLAEQLGISANGCRSLHDYWLFWSQTADPAISPKIFSSAVVDNEEKIRNWYSSEKGKPLVITAASKEEAMAFLCCVPNLIDKIELLGDQAVFVSSPETINKLSEVSTEFIPVAYTDEAQHELVVTFNNRQSIIIAEKNVKGVEPDICLDLPNYESFKDALSEMGFDESQIDVKSNQTSKSPTILRRQLARLPALRKPVWAISPERIRSMIPLVLAGTWKSNQDADKEILQTLAKKDYR